MVDIILLKRSDLSDLQLSYLLKSRELQSAQMFLLNKRFREERISPFVFIDGLKECRSLCQTAIQSLRFYSEEEQDRDRLEMATKSEAGIDQAIAFFTQQLGI